MSERLQYYGVKREVSEIDKSRFGGILMQLMDIPGAEEYFRPISPERLHTTLLYTREFSRTVRQAVPDAPITKMPHETWGLVINSGISKMPHTSAPTHAQIAGISYFKDRSTAKDGSKSFTVLLRSGQLTAERSHLVGMTNILSGINHRFGTGPSFLHHVTLGSIAKEHDPAFIAATAELVTSGKIAFDPVTTFTQLAASTDRHLAQTVTR